MVLFIRDVAEQRRQEAAADLMNRRFRLMVEEASEYGIFMLDPDGRVSTWNLGAQRILGYAHDEIVEQQLSILYPDRDVAAGKPAGELAEAAAAGRSEHEGWRIRKDGSRFWASAVVTAQRGTDATLLGFVNVTRDMTERKRQEDLQRALLDVADAVMTRRDEQELIELVAARARELLDAGLSIVAILDPDRGTAEVRASDGVAAASVEGLGLQVAGTPLGEQLASAEPTLLGEVRTELGKDASALPPGPGMVVPLIATQQCLGALILVDDGGGTAFGEADRQPVQVFAMQAAVALDYARARDELQRLVLVEDRERIARELHDGAIQALFAVGMGLQGIAQMSLNLKLRERLDEAVSQIDEVIRDLRNYIFGLRPGLVADRHLSQALLELAQQFEQRTGVVCAADIDAGVASRLASRAADIVQLTREALSNVGRHAAASTCRVSLRQGSEGAVLEIDDDGRGFTPGSGDRGWGLRNLGERAAALRGRMEIESVAGEGTKVTCLIPLPSSSPPRGAR
jgi:PAS domain S-box-containing protein